MEGFLASAGPFYDEGVTPVSYNPDKAAQLLSEAEADGGINLLNILSM